LYKTRAGGNGRGGGGYLRVFVIIRPPPPSRIGRIAGLHTTDECENTSKETYECEKRPVDVKRDL